MSESEKTYLDILREKTEKENSNRIDSTTFKKLLDAGEIGQIMSEGGLNLTKRQLRLVKQKSKEQAEENIRRRKVEVASQPGFLESIMIPAKRKMLEEAFAPKEEKKASEPISVENTKASKKGEEYKKKFAASNLKNMMADKKQAEAKSIAKKPSLFYSLKMPSLFGKKQPESLGGGGTMESFSMLLKKIDEHKKQTYDDKLSFEQKQEVIRENRHKEIMNVFLEATKANRKSVDEITKKVKKVKKEKLPEVQTKPPTEVTKPPTEVTKPPTEVMKPPTEVTKPPTEATKAPKEVVKPAGTSAAKEAAKKTADEAAKKAAELSTKKAAEEAAKKQAEEAAKKLAEAEAKKAAEKKVADEAARRAREDALKKQTEEAAKRETVKKVEPPVQAPPSAAPAPPVKPAPPTAKPTIGEAAKTAAKVAIGGAIVAGGGGAFADNAAGRKQFVDTMMPTVAEELKKRGSPTPPELVVGQWATESGWGKGTSGNFNYFGIKLGNWKGDKSLNVTKETLKDPKSIAKFKNGVDGREYLADLGNNKHSVKDWFRSYKSFNEAISDAMDFLEDKFPHALKAKDSTEFTKGLMNGKYGKYATDENYEDKVKGMSSSVLKLYKNSAKAEQKNSTGNSLNDISKENAGIKRDMVGNQAPAIIIDNKQTNNNRNVYRAPQAPQPNVNPMLGR